MTGYEPMQLKSQNPDRYLVVRRQILELIINDKISQEKIEEFKTSIINEQDIQNSLQKLYDNS